MSPLLYYKIEILYTFRHLYIGIYIVLKAIPKPSTDINAATYGNEYSQFQLQYKLNVQVYIYMHKYNINS